MPPRTRRDTGDRRNSDDSNPLSRATPNPYALNQDSNPTNAASHHGAASSNYPGYTQPWSGPTLHSSTQLQRYAVQYPSGRACGYGVWHDASYPVPFASTISTTDHEASRANAAVTYNSRITASTDINDPTTSGFQQNVVVRYGPTPGIADNDGCVHGTATTNAQAYGPAAEAPNSSEGLKAIARRYILDPDTNVDDVHMKPSACGRLKVTITLEVADDA